MLIVLFCAEITSQEFLYSGDDIMVCSIVDRHMVQLKQCTVHGWSAFFLKMRTPPPMGRSFESMTRYDNFDLVYTTKQLSYCVILQLIEIFNTLSVVQCIVLCMHLTVLQMLPWQFFAVVIIVS